MVLSVQAAPYNRCKLRIASLVVSRLCTMLSLFLLVDHRFLTLVEIARPTLYLPFYYQFQSKFASLFTRHTKCLKVSTLRSLHSSRQFAAHRVIYRISVFHNLCLGRIYDIYCLQVCQCVLIIQLFVRTLRCNRSLLQCFKRKGFLFSNSLEQEFKRI